MGNGVGLLIGSQRLCRRVGPACLRKMKVGYITVRLFQRVYTGTQHNIFEGMNQLMNEDLDSEDR